MVRSASGFRRVLWFLAGWTIVAGACVACARVDAPAATGGEGGATMPRPDSGIPTMPITGADAAPQKGAPTACVGLQCQQASCTSGQTQISGTVFAPNGKLPLFNVTVYIPNAPLAPFPAGVTCDRCGVVASGSPIVTALTNAEGKFVLNNPPAGTDIPLVMQVGKWRRKVTLPKVTACQDNPITDAELTRLPRNRQEGDMPKVAVTTGSCDQLGCLLPKLGIDPVEFGVAGDDKAIIFYQGGGNVGMGGPQFGPPNMHDVRELWDSEAELSKHDLTILSCECSENPSNKSIASFTNMTNYLAKGGRIFGSHYSYTWWRNATDPAFLSAAPIDMVGGGASPMILDTSFPKGKALADWMKFVDPAVTYGQIASMQIFSNLGPVMPPSATGWASSASSGGRSAVMMDRPRIVTVNTPAGMPADKQCGRAAHLDAHITTEGRGGPRMMPTSTPTTFPESCAGALTNGETALAFLFFDLSSCIQSDAEPPLIP